MRAMSGGLPFKELGRVLLCLGAVLAAVGLLLLFADKLPGAGRLPGDLLIRRGRWSIYIPLTTFLLISLLLTLLFNLFRR